VSDRVPVEVKRGKRNSEEGTEVVVKYFEEKYVPKGWFSPEKWVKEEKRMTIFFPKVSITSNSDIKDIYEIDFDKNNPYKSIPSYVVFPRKEGGQISEESEGWNFCYYTDLWGPHLYHAVVEEWAHTEWSNVLRIEHETKEVWILSSETYPNDVRRYVAKFHCPDLYDQALRQWWKLLEQVKSRKLEEKKSELEYLEKVGRYEELAQKYEYLLMPEKAGEIRRKARQVAEVRVDLNNLIRQLGERGFTITYHCSHCGAPLRIDAETEVEAIKSCRHCGSRIEAIDLAHFVKSFLS